MFEAKARDEAGRDGGARLYQLTLLFSDLSGYTALMEAADPEDVDAFRHQLTDIAKRTVEKHGGTVNQLYGDGVLAVFGLPVPDEEDARRAIQAALELHESVRHLPVEGRFPAAFQPRMHTGIETGLVLARQGNLLTGPYELTGDAVNTAARLCAAARADELLVSQTTLQGLQGLFDLTLIPPLTIHGKQKPVVAYRVLGRSKVRTRFEARARRGLTPFVGRDRQLDGLKAAMAQAIQGQAQLCGVVGPAGIGKSRLLEEFARWAELSDANIYAANCESYGNVAPLQPFLQAMHQLFGLRGETPTPDAVAAVEHRVRELGAPAPHLPTLLQLLSLQSWPDPSARLGEGTQRVIVNAVTDLFLALAARRPLVLSIDDWQWADDISRQVVASLHRSLQGARAMIVIGSRVVTPDDPVLHEANIFDLPPFTEDESGRAIRLLVQNVPDLGLSHAIHRRCGGNPLYLEELCQTLPAQVASSGEGLSDAAVPNTIHGVIQARIERLPPAEAGLLRIASVIGSDLPYWLLERLGGLGPVLQEALDRLAGEDLIYRTEKDSTFRFKHEITRDGVYQLVGRDERRRIHDQVARALESRAGGAGLAEHYEALAYHYAGSNDQARAAEYAELAGNKAALTSSLDRARLQYRAALNALDKVSDGRPATRQWRERWLAISMKWAATCVFSPAPEQLEVMQGAARHAEELNDANIVAHAEYWLGWIYYALGEQKDAITHHQRAVRSAEEAHNDRLRAQLVSNLGQSHAAAGEYEPALAYLREGIALKRAAAAAAGGRRGATPVGFGYALGCQAMVHGHRGEFDEAHRCLDEALDSVKSSGHAVEGSLLGARALIQMWQSCWELCIETAALSRATAERVNGPYVFAMGEMVSGYARWELDRAPGALVQLQRAVDWMESRGMRLYLSCNYAYLAEALATAERPEPAREYARRAIQRAAQQDPIGEASAFRTLARLAAAARGPLDPEAQAELGRAASAAERIGSPREVALTQLLAGELQVAADQGPAARASLEPAAAAFAHMRMPFYLAAARRLLEGL